MDIPAGTRLGRYEVRSKLGAGGMGEVYLAQDTRLDRLVALKILPTAVSASESRMHRFVQEAKAASSLNHPNIITIHEIDEADSRHLIAMEFIDGETLRDRMQAGRIAFDEVLDVSTQIAAALAAAHAAGIVHRDIKPENIMRRRDGLVKVLDFGLAKLSEPESTSAFHANTQLPTRIDAATEPGVVLGTAVYMSPEQARGRPVDARSDLFSLGVLMYEMVARRLPFHGSNTNEILASMLGDKEPDPLTQHATGVPAELERIISKALRKDPNQRYQTAKDLLIDLKDLTEARSSPAPATHSARRPGALVALLLVAAAAGYWFVTGRGPKTTAIDSIAVLPFENRPHDNALEYLADGVTESLINRLSQLQGVKVIARNSVFSYKNQSIELGEVARRLNVRSVLTGRVLIQGDTLDVRAELTDAANNTQLWGEHYTRKAADVVAVQDEIARRVAEALRVRLAGPPPEVARPQTASADAYRVYLQGRYFLHQGSEDHLKRALAFFDEAVALDPEYALAYAARAETYFNMGDINLPMREALSKAKQDVTKALTLDAALVEARLVQANIKFQYEWNFAGAEEDFRQVIASNPNNADAHGQYVYLLALTGRHREAVAQILQAQQLDPVSPMIVVDMSLPYFVARQYDQSIAHARRALDMFPEFFLPHMVLGNSLVERGDAAAGIRELEKARSLEASPLVLGNLGYAYAKGGRVDDARTVLAELKEQAKTRYVASYWPAVIHAQLGEKAEAFADLDAAYQQRSWWLIWIKTDPKVDALRSDPRFTDLMRRVGFQQ